MPTDKTMPKSNLHNFGGSRIVEHRDCHSLYGHYNSKATYEALLKRDPDDRPFVLTRSFNAGTQRYAAVWCGDATCSWSNFRKCIPMMLENSISGIAFVGQDIPGFLNDPVRKDKNGKDEVDELLHIKEG